MNRRAFLRGLLASGAVVVVAPVVSIAPPPPPIEDMIAARIKAAYAITLREMERNLFQGGFTGGDLLLPGLYEATGEIPGLREMVGSYGA